MSSTFPCYWNVIPVKERKVEQLTRDVSVFFFQNVIFRKRNVSLKSHFFRDLQRTVGLLGVVTMLLPLIINETVTQVVPHRPPFIFTALDLFSLSSPQIQSSCFPCAPHPHPQSFRHCMRVKRPVNFRMAPKKAVKGEKCSCGADSGRRLEHK